MKCEKLRHCLPFAVLFSLCCMNSACRNEPVGAQTQVSKATRNTFLHGKRDYYFYAYDNDPSTPETRCWYFRYGSNRSAFFSSTTRSEGGGRRTDQECYSGLATCQHRHCSCRDDGSAHGLHGGHSSVGRDPAGACCHCRLRWIHYLGCGLRCNGRCEEQPSGASGGIC